MQIFTRIHANLVSQIPSHPWSFLDPAPSLAQMFPYSRFFSFGAVSKDGPSKEMAEGTNFEMTLLGRGWKQEGKAEGKPDREDDNSQ